MFALMEHVPAELPRIDFSRRHAKINAHSACMLEASERLYVFKHGSRFFMLVALQRDKLVDVRTHTRVGTCDSPRTLFLDICTRQCCKFLAHALPKRALRRL